MRGSGPPGGPTFRTVYADPNYRRLFYAQTISRSGDTVAAIALLVLVFQLTGSGLGVSGVVVAEILPVLMLSPLAGPLIDRLPRRTVMIAADLWRAALAATLPLVDQQIIGIYLVAFGLSAGAVFFNPAAASALPNIVTDEQLLAANSGIWSAAVIAQIALAPLAGAAVTAWGVAPAFLLNAGTFAVSALVLTRLRLAPAPTAQAATWASRVLEGGRLVLRDRLLRLLAVVQMLAALSAGATSALLVVLATDRLDAGPTGLGVLLGAIGVGAAVGPFLLVRLTSNPRRPAFVFGPYLLRGVVDIVLATTHSLPTATVAVAVYGASTSTGMVTYTSMLQVEVPAHLRGRVFSAFDMIWQTGRLASLALGGLIADRYGIQAVYAVGGLLLLIAGILGLTGLGRKGTDD
ncbi:MAG: MFS transporter [Geodermatophilaceae bacterium]|nr:MFS transporter [Geodermatophilaceae bacterium]